MKYQYRHLAVGGTFDLLHRGHKALLKFTLARGAFVSIGVTSDELVQKIGKVQVENLKERLKAVKEFLKSESFFNRARVVVLEDIFGTALADKTIDGLVVTAETRPNALMINKKRVDLGLKPLALLIFPRVTADDGRPVSTGRIRQGIINREGVSFYKFLLTKKQFILPNELRPKLKRPYGALFANVVKLVESIDDLQKKTLITVGDECTKNFIGLKISANLAIVDLKINRVKRFKNIDELGFAKDQSCLLAKNTAGTINQSLILKIKNFFQVPRSLVIKVLGEEDLAVIPVVLLAPLEILVCYGQPNQGVVLIKVTEAKKAEFLAILKKFI